MKTKEITPQPYADYLGCSAQNVSKHIRNGLPSKFLPDVLQVKYYSRFVLLVVNEDLNVPEIRKIKNKNNAKWKWSSVYKSDEKVFVGFDTVIQNGKSFIDEEAVKKWVIDNFIKK